MKTKVGNYAGTPMSPRAIVTDEVDANDHVPQFVYCRRRSFSCTYKVDGGSLNYPYDIRVFQVPMDDCDLPSRTMKYTV